MIRFLKILLFLCCLFFGLSAHSDAAKWKLKIITPTKNYKTSKSSIDFTGKIKRANVKGIKDLHVRCGQKISSINILKHWHVKNVLLLKPGANLITCLLIGNEEVLASDSRKVIFTGGKPNAPPEMSGDEQKSLNEDQPLNFSLNGGIDPEGESLSYRLVTPPLHGKLTNCLNSDADLTCTYTPYENYFGPDTFSYAANDGELDSEPELISIEILSVNDAPIMYGEKEFNTDQNKPLVFTLKGASDIENDQITYRIKTTTSHGQLSGCLEDNGDVVCLYKPNQGFSGKDTFTYAAFDGQDESIPTEVVINVKAINSPPIMIGDDNYLTKEDESFSLTLKGATDVDQDELRYELISGPSKGTLSQCLQNNNDLTCDYSPNTDVNGVDTFSYRAFDGQLYSEVSIVTINITPVNDAPVILQDQNFEMNQGESLEFTLAGGTDIDSSELFYKLTQAPSAGVITGCFEGLSSVNCKYTPPSDFTGEVSFDYQVSDGELNSEETARVTILINEILPDDEVPPTISLVPEDGVIIRINTPTFTLSYFDETSGIDLNSVKIFVDGVDLSDRLAISFETAVLQFTTDFTLGVGNHEVRTEVSDLRGNKSSLAQNYTVELPEINQSFITGTVLDSNRNPISGVSVTDVDAPLNASLRGTTDQDGRFAIPFEIEGRYLIEVKKAGFTSGNREAVVILGRDLDVGEILLTSQDPKVTTIKADSGGSAANSTGTINVAIGAGVLSSDLDFNATEFLDGKALPGPLPELSAFTYALTFEPEGFDGRDKDVTLTLGNSLGFEEGTPIVLGYYDKELGRWLDSGETVVVTNNKHKAKLSQKNSVFTLPPLWRTADANTPLLCTGFGGQCQTPEVNVVDMSPEAITCEGCRIDLMSGFLAVDHETPSVERLGQNYNLEFSYLSTSAKPNFFVGNSLTNGFPEPASSINAEFTLGDKTVSFETSGEAMTRKSYYRLLIEATNAEGKYLPTGSYAYQSTLTSAYEGNPYATAAFFGGPPQVVLSLIASVPLELRSTVDDRTVIVNRRNSPIGTGWGLKGFESLHVDPEGTIVLDEGSDYPVLFTPLASESSSSQMKKINLESKALKKLGQLRAKNKQAPLSFNTPQISSMVSKNGFIYATDCRNNLVYQISYDGVVHIVAGNGERGFSGDGQRATNAKLSCPSGVYPRELGGFYIADKGNNRIRMVNKRGIITTIAGNGENKQSEDGTLGVEAAIGVPTSVTEDKMRSVHFTTWNKARYIGPRGKVWTYSESNGGHVPADLTAPSQVLFDKFDYPIVVDEGNNRVLTLYPQSQNYSTLLGSEEDKKKLSQDFSIKTMTYDPKLKRYFILSNSGKVYVWKGKGSKRVTELVINSNDDNQKFNLLVKSKKANLDKMNKVNLSAIAFSPERGLVISDGNEIMIPRNSSLSKNKDNLENVEIAISYEVQERYHLDLVKLTDGSYELTDLNQNKSYFNSNGKLTRKVNAKGNTTLYTYNTNGFLDRITYPTMDYTEFNYDGRGLLKTTIDPAGRVTRFNHDAKGRLTEIINPDETKKIYQYDNDGLLIQKTDEAGKTTRFEYRNSRIVKETRDDGSIRIINPEMLQGLLGSGKAYSKSGKFKSDVVYPEDIEVTIDSYSGDCATKSQYDDFNRLSSIEDCLGNKTTFVADLRGNITREDTAEGTTRSYIYDNRDRVVRSTDQNGQTRYEYDNPFGLLSAITNDLGKEMILTYDEKSNLTTIKDFSGYETHFEYNPMGSVTSITDMQENQTRFEYDSKENLKKLIQVDGSAVEYIRDLVGNITSIKDSENNITMMSYDNHSRVTEIKDALNGITSFSYSNSSNLLSLVDAKSAETKFEYNNPYDLVSKVTDPLNLVQTYEYDGNERLRLITQEDNSVIKFDYDLNGSLIQSDSGDQVLGFVYDRNNRLTGASTNDFQNSFTYDEYDRLSASGNSFLPATIVKNYYGRVGRVDETIFATVNSIGREIVHISKKYSYTDNGQVNSISFDVYGVPAFFTRTFNDLNLPVKDTINDLVTTDYVFDNRYRVTSIDNKVTGSNLSKYVYDYSPNGNIKKITETGLELSNIKEFNYDKLNRIVSSNKEGSFNYDLNGNRLDFGANYNLANQRISDGQNDYAYDPRGNLISRVDRLSNTEQKLTWNNLNQLIKVENYLGTTLETEVNYKYDALNRRIETVYNNLIKPEESKTRRLIYDGEDVLLELDGNNRPVAIYLHGPGIDEPLGMVRDINGDGDFDAKEVFYFTRDHLGSVRELLDYKGDIYQRYTYTVYGDTKITKYHGRSDNKFIENRYAYTSRELDQYTGLYYYRARWYDPRMGMFISKDPIGFQGGTVNLYNYGKSNPLRYKDPDGKNPLAIALVTATVGGVVGAFGGFSLSKSKTFFGKVKDTAKGFAVGATGGFFAGVFAAPVILGTVTGVVTGTLTTLSGIAIDAAINLIGLGDIATGGPVTTPKDNIPSAPVNNNNDHGSNDAGLICPQ